MPNNDNRNSGGPGGRGKRPYDRNRGNGPRPPRGGGDSRDGRPAGEKKGYPRRDEGSVGEKRSYPRGGEGSGGENRGYGRRDQQPPWDQGYVRPEERPAEEKRGYFRRDERPDGEKKSYPRRNEGSGGERRYPPRDGQRPQGQGYPPRDGRPPQGQGYRRDERPDRDKGGYPRREDGFSGDKKNYPRREDGTGGERRYPPRDGRPPQGQGYRRDERPDRGKGNYPRHDGRPPWDREGQAPVEKVAPAPVREDELPYLVMGRNAVREALRSGRSIDRILVVSEPDGSLRELTALARDRNVQVREVSKTVLDEMCLPFGHGSRTGNHQGIVAQVPGVEYCDVGDILDYAKSLNQPPFLLLLDGIEDPHNLGSILRSAECAGVHGVIIPKRRSASVTAAVAKASAGAVEYMRVARVANLANAIDRLKQANVWIAGAHMQGVPMAESPLEGAVAFVIGGEGEGLSRLVREKCDFLVSIPLRGKIESLNASVAAAVLLYAKLAKDDAHAPDKP